MTRRLAAGERSRDVLRSGTALPDVTREALADVNWARVSAAFVPTHTADACRVHATRCLSLFHNTGNIEDLGLPKAKRKRGDARTTHQSPDDSPPPDSAKSRDTRPWTEEEDRALVSAVNEFMAALPKDEADACAIDWQDVACAMRPAHARSAPQCATRWQKTLDPAVRRAAWSDAEDAWLSAACARIGPDAPQLWQRVADWLPREWRRSEQTSISVLGRRTDVQCRERRSANTQAAQRTGPWTRREDALLERAVRVHAPGRWSAVAQDVPSRTDSQCRRRWAILRRR